MSAPQLDCDVCVIGAGPAGSATALRLAGLGHDVCLVERDRFPRHRIGESLPPSILPLLDTLGVRPEVEAAGFLRPHAAIVHWAGTTGSRDYGDGAAGFQVDRGAFDSLLLQAACRAGTRLVQPARARPPQQDTDGSWRIDLTGARATTTPIPAAIRARVVVVATGRRPRGAARYAPVAPATAALYAYWPLPSGLGPETRIEAGRDAWYWGAPLPDGSFNAAVFVDRGRCAGLSLAARWALYRELLAESSLLGSCLDGTAPARLRICDAGSHASTDPARGTLLRVGEASVAIDPLSSQGVQSAIASAIQAATAINTLIRTPSCGPLARRYYRDRQQDTASLHKRLAAGHYARQARHDPSPFWAARADGAADDSGPAVTVPAPPDADTPVALSCNARIAASPVVVGDLVEPGQAVAHPGLDRPLVFLDGIAVAPLLQSLPRQINARGLHEAWAAQVGPDRAGGLLTWLWTRRILVPDRSVWQPGVGP